MRILHVTREHGSDRRYGIGWYLGAESGGSAMVDRLALGSTALGFGPRLFGF